MRSFGSFVRPILLSCAVIVTVFVFAKLIARSQSGRSDPKLLARIGTTAPDFTLPLVGGGEISLSQMRGNVVVLDFWAVWCPPCVEALPKLNRLAADYKDRGVRVLAINLGDDPTQVSKFLQSNGLTLPVAISLDSKTGELYGAEYIPLTVVIDALGKIRQIGNLAPDEADDLLPKWIESAAQ